MKKVYFWKQLVSLEDEFDHRKGEEWVFRGQPSPKYRMQSSLERACVDFNVKDRNIEGVEDTVIKDFKRSCQSYAPSWLPAEGDTLGWMALMRHYGAPCRLVDFTFSLFIATYFAVEAEYAKPVIWAVNKAWLSKYMKKIVFPLTLDKDNIDGKKLWDEWFHRKGRAFDRLFFEPNALPPFVAPVAPLKKNDRLLRQQGLFLAATKVRKPFHDTLESMPERRYNIIEIRIPTAQARFEILRKLQRAGLSRNTLFPGLQGFAESLRSKILITLGMERLRREGGRIGPRTTGA